ncbi:hypothetical protein DSY14_23800 [Nocardiopsis sp. MG754419]|nr:hypothetical protein [Nocardiopsis sp. MG754419]
MGVLSGRRGIRPNDVFGIRAACTRSGEAAWYAVHEASTRWSLLAGVAFLPAVILTPLIADPNGQIAAILVPTFLGTVIPLVESWRAHRIARERPARAEGRADLP